MKNNRSKRVIIALLIAIFVCIFFLTSCLFLSDNNNGTTNKNGNKYLQIIEDFKNSFDSNKNNDETKQETEVTTDKTADSYYVEFVNIDGTVLQKTLYKEGETPSYNGNTPTYKDDDFTYTFIGWDKTITSVSSTQTYKATYSKVAKTTVATKKTPTLTAPTANNFKYDGTTKELIYAGTVTGGTLQYKLNDGKYSTDIPKAKDAGTYTVYYKVLGNDGYEDIAEASIEVKISKRSITLTSSSSTKDYDGTALTNSGITTSGDGFVAGEGATVNVTGSQTNAGTSVNHFTYTLNNGTNSANYTIEKKEGNLIVNKKKVTVPSANANLTYNAAKQTGVTLPNYAKYTLINNVATNAGTYTATATLTDKINYEWNLSTPTASDQTITWSISKVKVNEPTISGTYTYDGTEKTVVFVSAISSYIYTNNSLKQTSAGNYNIVYTLTDTNNYEWNNGSDGIITWTINKADQATAPAAPTLASSTTNSITLNSITTIGHGNIEYSVSTSNTLPGSIWQTSTEFTGLTNGINYYFYSRYAGDSNHNPSAASNCANLGLGHNVKIEFDLKYMATKEGGLDNKLVLTFADDSSITINAYMIGYSDKGYWTIDENGDEIRFDNGTTFYNVKTIYKADNFITYTDDTGSYTHEFKNGIFNVTKNITIIGTGTGNCIDENSLVTMADGSLKAMKDIEIGDEVLSIDYDTMTLVARKVIYTSKDEEGYENWNVPSYYLHTFSDGTTIKRAMRHRFYCLESESYKHMDTWEEGLHAYKIDGTNPTLVSTEIIQEPLHYARITLEGSNNYFANGLSTGDSECCPNGAVLNTKLINTCQFKAIQDIKNLQKLFNN